MKKFERIHAFGAEWIYLPLAFPGFFLTLEPFSAPLPLLALVPTLEGFLEVDLSASWGFWALSNVLSGAVMGTQHRKLDHGEIRWELFQLRLLHDEASTPWAILGEALYIMAL